MKSKLENIVSNINIREKERAVLLQEQEEFGKELFENEEFLAMSFEELRAFLPKLHPDSLWRVYTVDRLRMLRGDYK